MGSGAKACSFSICLCHSEAENDVIDDIHDRNAKQKELLTVSVYNFAQGIKPIKGNP